ncbi:four-carbon acid sugar kinase family protein [Actinomadura kijaniata]|uniref:four-carbon acid sugar kinase family protein n=1 Tax=Actinomadura kijaniata TaxID=46161 RepID=UPI003F1DD9C3
MPAGIAVLADDLTSAGDGAAPFRRAGHRARILLSASAGAPGGVTAVDLGSRLLDEADAATRVREAARLFAGSGLLVKTVDSTLRGHVAAEVHAAWEGSGRRAAVVAPAFPAEGRVTVGGVQHVDGVPVHLSAYARDPVHPVRGSDLAELFPAAVLAERAADVPALVDAGKMVVCSAVSDADLDRLVAAVPRPDEVLWAGSPGLAAALARAHPGPDGAAPAAPPPVRRLLVVAGSANPVTRRQLAALRALGGVPEVVVGDPAATARRLRELPGPVLTLRAPAERRPPAAITRALAAVVSGLVEDGFVDALVLTGGATAVAVLSALGVTGLDLLDEPEPGAARGVPLERPRPSVLMKAGGFGDDAMLHRLSRVRETL